MGFFVAMLARACSAPVLLFFPCCCDFLAVVVFGVAFLKDVFFVALFRCFFLWLFWFSVVLLSRVDLLASAIRV